MENDNVETSVDEKNVEEELEIEIESDVPEEDRGKEPLPEDIVSTLEKPEEGGEYSDDVITKFKQYKKVWHDVRREKEQALREQAEALKLAEGLLEENKKLKSSLSTGEKAYIATAKDAADKDLELAKKQYKDAYDSGDSEQIMEAQEKLTNASLNVAKTKDYRPTVQEDENSVQVPQRSQTENKTQPVDPKFADWQRRNSNWFNLIRS